MKVINYIRRETLEINMASAYLFGVFTGLAIAWGIVLIAKPVL